MNNWTFGGIDFEIEEGLEDIFIGGECGHSTLVRIDVVLDGRFTRHYYRCQNCGEIVRG